MFAEKEKEKKPEPHGTAHTHAHAPKPQGLSDAAKEAARKADYPDRPGVTVELGEHEGTPHLVFKDEQGRQLTVRPYRPDEFKDVPDS